MGFFDDDLFGGMFDFNGDGKTTFDEAFIAFSICDEMTKHNDGDDPGIDDLCDLDELYDLDDDFDAELCKTRFYAPSPRVSLNTPVKTYSKFSDVLSAVFTGLLFSFVPLVITWAALTSYDPAIDMSWLVTLIFAGGSLTVLCIIWHTVISVIKEYLSARRTAKSSPDESPSL